MSAGMSIAFALEKQVALSAVRRACGLTASVFNQLVKNETLTKDDRSPVTVADYAAQAVISTILQCAFPEDPIVGEEDASELRGSDNQGLRDKIVSLANEALTEDLGIGENVEWGLGPGKHRTASQLLDAIDKGNYAGGPAGRKLYNNMHQVLLISRRNVDNRSSRWNERLLARRTIRGLRLSNHRCTGQTWRYRLSKSSF